MPSHYEKLSRPSGPSLDTTHITIPEKAALSNVTTITPSTTTEKSPRMSSASTPRSERTDNPFDTDVEAMIPSHSQESCMSKCATKQRMTDCQVWPGKDQWKKNAKATKMKRGCNCLARLSKRNQIIAKILIGFLVIGIAVGVGFGVSKPLGAPIWGDNKKE